MRYAVHNVVRGRTNRSLRARSPERLRLAQFVGGRRVLRGRPLFLSEEELAHVLPELREKARRGAIELRTTDGRRIDLATLDATPLAPAPPSAHPPLDTLARDEAWGERLVPGGEVPTLFADQADAPPNEESAAPEAPPVRPEIPAALAPHPPVAVDDEPKVPALLTDAAREDTAQAQKRGRKQR